MVDQDPNGKEVLAGVKTQTVDELKRQGHRWPDCPEYVAINVFAGMSSASILQQQQMAMVVAAVLCRCGAILTVPLG